MRRPVKFALLAIVFAMAPFCWSVGRDLLPFLLTGGNAADTETRIALQLAAEHQRMHVGERRALASMSLPHNCFSVLPTAVRTKFRLLDENIDGAVEESRSTPSIVAMNAYGIAYARFADAQGVEALQKNLSLVELAALNGCIGATPFAKWCDRRVEENMGFDFRLVEQDMVARGLMRRAIDEHAREILCTTIPVIEDHDAAP